MVLSATLSASTPLNTVIFPGSGEIKVIELSAADAADEEIVLYFELNRVLGWKNIAVGATVYFQLNSGSPYAWRSPRDTSVFGVEITIATCRAKRSVPWSRC